MKPCRSKCEHGASAPFEYAGGTSFRHVPFLSVSVASAPMTIYALRLHGRDDHANLFALSLGSALYETERAGVQLVNCWPFELLCLACHVS
jgi:hypothetical protein